LPSNRARKPPSRAHQRRANKKQRAKIVTVTDAMVSRPTHLVAIARRAVEDRVVRFRPIGRALADLVGAIDRFLMVSWPMSF